MTDSRNVVHSLERASHVHSDHIIEKRMKIQKLQEVFPSKVKKEKKIVILNQMVKKII